MAERLVGLVLVVVVDVLVEQPCEVSTVPDDGPVAALASHVLDEEHVANTVSDFWNKAMVGDVRPSVKEGERVPNRSRPPRDLPCSQMRDQQLGTKCIASPRGGFLIAIVSAVSKGDSDVT